MSTNVRFLLWKRKEPSNQWSNWLSRTTQLPEALAARIVAGNIPDSQISEQVLRELARAFDQEESELRYRDFAHEHGILRENLSFLFQSAGHGSKRKFSDDFDVAPTTISRWLNGTFEPAATSLRDICSYFGLPVQTDLHQEPLFLSIEPRSVSQRRAWLREKLDGLPANQLTELYPALRRLLAE